MIARLLRLTPAAVRAVLALVLVASLAPVAAHARALYGAEFNFSNMALIRGQTEGHIVNSEASEAARDALSSKIAELCTECKIEPRENSYGVTYYHVTYPDGFYVEISTDPSVVEIQTKPSTVEQLQAHAEILQKHIFDAARSVGLLPAAEVMGDTWAGSHIHVGTKAALGDTRNSVRLLKDFMVDFSNHRELAEGIFSSDTLNAPPLARLPEKERKAFEQIVEDVDNGHIRSINTFAARVRKEVYDVALSSDVDPTTKYQAFNVNRIGNKKFAKIAQTFELRAMRGPRTADDFLAEVELIQARLDYLKTHPNPPLALPLTYMSDEQKVEAFYRYVTETGLSFDRYERFLKQWQLAYLPAIKVRYGGEPPTCQLLFLSAH